MVYQKWLNGKLCYQNLVDNKMFFSMQLQRNGNELYLNLGSASILGKTKAFLIKNELTRIETKVIPTEGSKFGKNRRIKNDGINYRHEVNFLSSLYFNSNV